MFRNYIKIALRNIRRQKAHSFITVAGLSIGIACSILIFLFITNEFSYDKFHSKADRLYRVWQKEYNPNRETLMSSETPFPLAGVLKESFPEVVDVVRFLFTHIVVKVNNVSFPESVMLADPGFFRMFTFPILKGNPDEPLHDLNSIVITKETADKYFSGSEAVGQKMTLQLQEEEMDFTVSAVTEEIPGNSSINFSMVIPFENGKSIFGERIFHAWGNVAPQTFLLLRNNINVTELTGKFDFISKNHYQPYMGEDWRSEYFLQPITDIHLNTDVPGRMIAPSNPMYSYILLAIGIFILFIASVNFMTLSLSMSAGRAKEVGVRKVMGAFGKQLARQYMSEAIFISYISMIFGILLARILLPEFNELSGKNLAMNFNLQLIALLFFLPVMIGLCSGSYPAIVLSRFQPSNLLKSSMKLSAKNLLSKILTVIQFALSIIMIFITIVITMQFRYISNKNLGYNNEGIVFIKSHSTPSRAKSDFEVYKNEIISSNMVVKVSAALNQFGIYWTKVGFNEQTGAFREFFLNVVDYDYIKTLGIVLVSGRDFSREITTDENNAIIVNEAFLDYFGWDTPYDKKLPGRHFNPHSFIGVVRNFNFSSLHSVIRPLALVLNNRQPVWSGINDVVGGNSGGLGFIIVRIKTENVKASMDFLKKEWESLFPERPFDYNFLDDMLLNQYTEEQRWNKIINYSSLLAILIACLGLYGLSSFIIEQKTKEIGIRKILGAPVERILTLLAGEFILLTVFAFIIAWPVAWFTAHKWLQNFAYHIHINIFIFLASGMLVLLIILLTIGYRSIRAATANPVDSLKYE